MVRAPAVLTGLSDVSGFLAGSEHVGLLWSSAWISLDCAYSFSQSFFHDRTHIRTGYCSSISRCWSRHFSGWSRSANTFTQHRLSVLVISGVRKYYQIILSYPKCGYFTSSQLLGCPFQLCLSTSISDPSSTI